MQGTPTLFPLKDGYRFDGIYDVLTESTNAICSICSPFSMKVGITGQVGAGRPSRMLSESCDCGF